MLHGCPQSKKYKCSNGDCLSTDHLTDNSVFDLAYKCPNPLYPFFCYYNGQCLANKRQYAALCNNSVDPQSPIISNLIFIALK